MNVITISHNGKRIMILKIVVCEVVFLGTPSCIIQSAKWSLTPIAINHVNFTISQGDNRDPPTGAGHCV